jgi:hypothetical protein
MALRSGSPGVVVVFCGKYLAGAHRQGEKFLLIMKKCMPWNKVAACL